MLKKNFKKSLEKVCRIKKWVYICISNLSNQLKKKPMLYVRTPLFGNEFKVCDEITDEVIAIFFNQKDAIEYVNLKTNTSLIF